MHFFEQHKVSFFLVCSALLLTCAGIAPKTVRADELPASDQFSEQIEQVFENDSSDTEAQVDDDFTLLEQNELEDTDGLISALQEEEQNKSQYFLTGTSSEPGEITEEWQREKNYMLFGFTGEEQFTGYSPKICVTDVSQSGDDLTCSIYEWMTITYKEPGNTEPNVSGYGYQYSATLCYDDQGWNLLFVKGSEENFKEMESEGVDITSDGVTAGPEEDDSGDEQDEEPSGEDSLVGAKKQTSVSWKYNVQKAKAYADKYCLTRNESYKWWGDEGGDCANFVSQCLYAGGFPKSATWFPNASEWIGQNELRSYLIRIKAGKLLSHPKSKDLNVGDIVWYDWDGSGDRTNHVTICVAKNSAGIPLIDSHTAARYHYKWNYGGKDTTYLAMQMKESSKESNNSSKSNDASKSNSTSKSNNTSKSSSTSQKVYRLYNKNNGEHFYTCDNKEKKYLVGIGWKDEGTGWVATKGSGKNVYRLYNPNTGDHHYTKNLDEKKSLTKTGWRDEGTLCKVVDKSNKPLYRLYNPNAKKAGSHHYTKNSDEKDYLVKIGWKYEGIAWYSAE